MSKSKQFAQHNADKNYFPYFSVAGVKDFPEVGYVLEIKYDTNRDFIHVFSYIAPDASGRPYFFTSTTALFIKWFNYQTPRNQGRLLSKLPELSSEPRIKIRGNVLENVAMRML